jgi:hypothetical protein
MLVSVLYETNPLSPPLFVLWMFSWERVGVMNDFYFLFWPGCYFFWPFLHAWVCEVLLMLPFPFCIPFRRLHLYRWRLILIDFFSFLFFFWLSISLLNMCWVCIIILVV